MTRGEAISFTQEKIMELAKKDGTLGIASCNLCECKALIVCDPEGDSDGWIPNEWMKFSPYDLVYNPETKMLCPRCIETVKKHG